MALVNRLTPQIAIFYVATPFVVAGGLVLLYFTIKTGDRGLPHRLRRVALTG